MYISEHDMERSLSELHDLRAKSQRLGFWDDAVYWGAVIAKKRHDEYAAREARDDS